MNSTQYEEAKAIIEGDCEIAHRYENSGGKTCVLGALGKAAGYAANYQTMTGSIGYMKLGGLVEAIKEHFGLPLAEQIRLQLANDQLALGPIHTSEVVARRLRVMHELDAWAKEGSPPTP